ncbi:hypothetical protein CPC08DRAFT_713690 [Agrocybe pediades]|nr:hypothetical protein CPC08DRAFT_713690 [Agrocybe pediades]
MKFALSTAIIALAGFASASIVERQSCPQATRFGVVTVSPTTVSPGDTITINVDLHCAVQNFGIQAQFLDYTIEVPSSANNGHEPPIVLARHNIAAGALSDSLTTTIPHAFFFAGAPYNIVVTNGFPSAGTDGSPVVTEGGVLTPITINA